MIVYWTLFAIVKVYVQVVLYTDRHVYYIQIAEEATRVAEKALERSENRSNDSGSTSKPSEKRIWSYDCQGWNCGSPDLPHSEILEPLGVCPRSLRIPDDVALELDLA